MPRQVLNQASELIRARMKAIAEERERLEAEQAELEAVLKSMPSISGGRSRVGASLPSKTRSKSSKSSRQRVAGRQGSSSNGSGRAAEVGSRKRAPKGLRQLQLLDTIESEPGQPIAEMAKRIGVGPTQLYPIIRRLKTEGLIVPKGDGFEPANRG